MRELDVIVERYEQLKKEGTTSVLATVVHVDGSSYRRSGARMLIDEYGNITGAISGGCLEGDALKKALLALHQNKNKLITYDTSDEDDVVIGAQLGCNGIIRVLFEPLNYDDDQNACEILSKTMDQREPTAIGVLFNLDATLTQLGTIVVVNDNLDALNQNENFELLNTISSELKSTFQKAHNTFSEIFFKHANHHLFLQYYLPAVKLVIVGAGNDAQILAQQADLLGWKVIVTDGRTTHANTDRFTSSCQIIVSKPELTLNHIEIDSRTCVVLMSHNYHYDLEVLKLLIPQIEIPYIGILGPLKKWQKMQDDLESQGFEITQKLLHKIHAPVGLDLAAETPAEIGLSILAEIQAVITKSSAQPLKNKKQPIHERIDSNFKTTAS